MKKYLLVTFFVMLLSLGLVFKAKAQGCSGARGPSFEIGDRFVVPYGDGPSGLFTEPNKVPKIASLEMGSGGTVLDGPFCVTGQEGNLYSWFVETDLGYRGWVSEGYEHSAVAWIEPAEEESVATPKPRATSTPKPASVSASSDNNETSGGSSGYEEPSPVVIETEEPAYVGWFAWVVIFVCGFFANLFFQEALVKTLKQRMRIDQWSIEKLLLFSTLCAGISFVVIYVATNNFGAAVSVALGGGSAPPVIAMTRRNIV